MPRAPLKEVAKAARRAKLPVPRGWSGTQYVGRLLTEFGFEVRGTNSYANFDERVWWMHMGWKGALDFHLGNRDDAKPKTTTTGASASSSM